MGLTDSEIFEQARGIESSHERHAYLREVCKDESQLQRLVKLLDVDLDDSFLEHPTADFAGLSGPPDRSGEVIESYRLLEKIGHGGMGVVYRAEQFEPISRIVAVKLVRIDLSIDQVVPRFNTERQALAMMEHPNIARFYDAGTTSRGNPYFVMEFVEGVTLTKYCDQNRLTITERIELFRKICNAVTHAHQKGIVHRDLKPGNIIITQIDGCPVPKVIDFGLAKSQNSQWDHETAQTDFGQFLGTLAYMSPEQASNSSAEIDARSDVYSLGIILYELLVGATPFSLNQFKEVAFDEVVRIIRDSDPPTPVSSLENSKSHAEIAAQRKLDTTQLQRLVRGDLELIVMKTLEKEPERRYQSADQLAADIDRFSHQQPVHARAPSLFYRAKKYVRRNQSSVALATVAIVAVIAGIWLSGLWRKSPQTEAEKFEVAIARVERMIDANELQQAMDELDQLVETSPGRLKPYLLSARVFERRGEYDRQVEELGKAIEIFPNHFDTRIERAKAHQLSEPANLISAEQDLKVALSIRKDDPVASRLLTELRFMLPCVGNDGQCVLFGQSIENGSEDYCATPDGSLKREINISPGHVGPKQIVKSIEKQLFLIRLNDGRESPQMTSSIDGISISTDKRTIVYQDRTRKIYDLVRMDFDGGNRKILIKNRMVYTPVVSPDGQKIAFMIVENGDMEIAMINIDGSDFTLLTKSKGRDGGLAQGAWDKESKRIVFMSERKSRPRRVYVMDVESLQTIELGVGMWPSWAEIDELGQFVPRENLEKIFRLSVRRIHDSLIIKTQLV